MPPSLPSERLDLVSLSPAFLRAVLQGDLAVAEREIGATLPDEILSRSNHGPMKRRLGQLEADPSLQPWLIRGLVLREQNVMVGHISFHDAPGAEYLEEYSPHALELGQFDLLSNP